MKRFTLLLCTFLCIYFPAHAQQLVNVGEIPCENAGTSTLFTSTSSGITVAVKGLGNPFLSFDNLIYEYNGNAWTYHSSLMASTFKLSTPFKTSDGKYWCIGNTQNGIIMQEDTAALFSYSNNQWNIHQLLKTGMAPPPNLFDAFDAKVNYKNNQYWFLLGTSKVYVYINTTWVDISLTAILSTPLYQISELVFNDSAHAKAVLFRTDNLTHVFCSMTNNTWIIEDSIVLNPGNNTSCVVTLSMFSQDSGYVAANTFNYVAQTSTFKLYSYFNGKLTQTGITPPKSGLISAQYKTASEGYFTIIPLFGLNDSLKIFRYNGSNFSGILAVPYDHSLRPLLTGNGFMAQTTVANGSTYKSYLYKTQVTAKPLFSYTANGMVVQFNKLDPNCTPFLWDFDNGNTSNLNGNPTVTYASAGTYRPCLSCGTTDTMCVTITLPCNNCSGTTGIKKDSEAYSSIYPNPAKDFIHITNPGKTNTVFSISDLSGRMILTGTVENEKIDILKLLNGIYILELTSPLSYQAIRLIKQ